MINRRQFIQASAGAAALLAASRHAYAFYQSPGLKKLQVQILEQVPTHSLGFEALLGDLARRFAVPSIITVDLVNGVGCG